MGCCQSTSSARDGLDPRNHDSPARVAANRIAASALQPNSRSNAAQQIDSPNNPRYGPGASPALQTTDSSSIARPNKPIRPPSPLLSSPSHLAHQPPPWTRAQLARERDAFFDTRISGSPEVWAGLRIVAETLRRVDLSASALVEGQQYTAPTGEHDEDFDDEHARDKVDANITEAGLISPSDESVNALATAQALLDALNLTCPQGRVASGRGHNGNRQRGGVYDERGTLYELPAWVVRDPDDLIEENDAGSGRGIDSEKDDLLNTSSTDGLNDAAEKSAPPPDSNSPWHRTESKGKGRAKDIGELIPVRIRLSDRARDIVVKIGERQTIADLLQIVCEHVGMTPWPEESSAVANLLSGAPSKPESKATSGSYVRLAFLGKLLEPRRSLADSGWSAGQVINAFVF